MPGTLGVKMQRYIKWPWKWLLAILAAFMAALGIAKVRHDIALTEINREAPEKHAAALADTVRKYVEIRAGT